MDWLRKALENWSNSSKLTIQVKIFIILLAFLVAQASFQLYQNIKQAETAIETSHDIQILLRAAEQRQMLNEMKLAIIQVQQWLTDVSATRGLDGLNDGWDKAGDYAKLFHDQSAKLKANTTDAASIKKIEEAEKIFDTWYVLSKKMAEAYVKDGPASGNQLMAKVDPTAEDLVAKVAEVSAPMDAKFTEIAELVKDSAKDIATTRNLAIVAAVILIIINLAVLNIFFRITVVNPVNMISHTADRIANGDLTSEIETNRSDEIGLLSQALHKMQENLKVMIQKINQSSSDVTRSAEELSVLARHIAEGSEKQTDQASHVAASVEEMSATITEIARNSNEALESSNDAKGAAMTGANVVQETIGGIHRISSAMEKSAKVVEALGHNSDQISQIVSVIDDIADQTNLLALNAAIEAARAGEAGRGFAVVADEVRKLAERTTKATKEIATMISKIQADTRDAVMSMGTVMDEVKTGVRSADETGQSLGRIVERVQNSADMVSHIATASEQQSKTVEEISHNMHSVAEISKETTRDTLRTSSAAEKLTQLASDLKKLVEQFKA